MVAKADRLRLECGTWYAMTMLPGYGAGPYYSPVRIDRVKPMKTGKSIIDVEYWNIGYADEMYDFRNEFRIIAHGETYLIAARSSNRH